VQPERSDLRGERPGIERLAPPRAGLRDGHRFSLFLLSVQVRGLLKLHETGGQGQDRTVDLPLFRRSVADRWSIRFTSLTARFTSIRAFQRLAAAV
jgi:hypothetical protein